MSAINQNVKFVLNLSMLHSYKSVERNSNPLELIHTDICDKKSTPSCGGKKYFITFIDDWTRYWYVYLLNDKDETIDAFRQYKTEVENQLDKKIKNDQK